MIGRVDAAGARAPVRTENGELNHDRVVLVGAPSHRDDHAIDVLMSNGAVLLGRQVLGVRRAAIE